MLKAAGREERMREGDTCIIRLLRDVIQNKEKMGGGGGGRSGVMIVDNEEKEGERRGTRREAG